MHLLLPDCDRFNKIIYFVSDFMQSQTLRVDTTFSQDYGFDQLDNVRARMIGMQPSPNLRGTAHALCSSHPGILDLPISLLPIASPCAESRIQSQNLADKCHHEDLASMFRDNSSDFDSFLIFSTTFLTGMRVAYTIQKWVREMPSLSVRAPHRAHHRQYEAALVGSYRQCPASSIFVKGLRLFMWNWHST